MIRRPRGTGGFYYNHRQGLWTGVAMIETPNGGRKRKYVTSRSRDVALKKLYAILPEGTPFVDTPEPPDRPLTLTEAARERGTHTADEWEAKKRAADYACNYCGTVMGPQQVEQDHIIPLSRGGSDAIHNIVPACAACNSEKGTMTAEEYFAFRGRVTNVWLEGRMRE